MSYKETRHAYENLERRIFPGVGKYGIPELQATPYEGGCEFIGFNFAKGCKNKEEKGVHFFVDDYQMLRLWRYPDHYVDLLKQFKYVMTPDYSMYTDFPMAIQILGHYRRHWIGAYLQEAGARVIPTISWSTPDSYEWCFDGEPIGGVVAVSSVGTQNSKKRKELFVSGYKEMVRRLQPETIIFHGSVPPECMGNIVRVRAYSEKFREAKCDVWEG